MKIAAGVNLFVPALELQTKVPEDYAKIEQSRRRPLLDIRPTSAFTFKTLLKHYDKRKWDIDAKVTRDGQL